MAVAALGALAWGFQGPVHSQPSDLKAARDWYKAWADSQPRPPEKLVNRIEALLAKEKCVGDLGGWSRSYAYDYLPERTVDTGIVDFHLEEAGRFGVKAGKNITQPDAWVNIDDRPMKMADGDYDVRENRIRFAFCGNNVGPAVPGTIDHLGSYFGELKRRRRTHGTESALPPNTQREVPISPQPGNPSDGDKAVLQQTIDQCHLHPGSLYFVQYEVPREPVIRMTRSLGDTDAQLQCAMSHFPADFAARFGTEFEISK
jgi:hypothetical protein